MTWFDSGTPIYDDLLDKAMRRTKHGSRERAYLYVMNTKTHPFKGQQVFSDEVLMKADEAFEAYFRSGSINE